VCVYIKKFSPESVGEGILKIGPLLLKLLSNIKGYTFLGDSVLSLSGKADTQKGCVNLGAAVRSPLCVAVHGCGETESGPGDLLSYRLAYINLYV